MTKKSPAKMLELCDTLASGAFSYAAASRVCGLAPRTLWLWIKQSQQDAEANDCMLDYLGEKIPFHVALDKSREQFSYQVRSQLKSKAPIRYETQGFLQCHKTLTF